MPSLRPDLQHAALPLLRSNLQHATLPLRHLAMPLQTIAALCDTITILRFAKHCHRWATLYRCITEQHLAMPFPCSTLLSFTLLCQRDSLRRIAATKLYHCEAFRPIAIAKLSCPVHCHYLTRQNIAVTMPYISELYRCITFHRHYCTWPALADALHHLAMPLPFTRRCAPRRFTTARPGHPFHCHYCASPCRHSTMLSLAVAPPYSTWLHHRYTMLYLTSPLLGFPMQCHCSAEVYRTMPLRYQALPCSAFA